MRRLCWWAIPCSAAIFLAVYLLPRTLWPAAGILCALAVPAGLLLHGKPRLRVMLAASGLAVGFLWTAGYTAWAKAPVEPLLQAEKSTYTLQVCDYPSPSKYGMVMDARVLLPDGSRPKVRFYCDQTPFDLRPGDLFSCSAHFAPADVIHGERASYYPAKGVFLFGYADGPVQWVRRIQGVPWLFLPQYAAQALKSALTRLFPDELRGFFTALITGDKSAMPTGLYAAFQRAGISHIVVVSGLHIGFLAMAAAYVLGKRSAVGTLFTILALFFFALLAGASPSALRSAIMTSLLLLAPRVDREADKLTTLSTALTVLLLCCPYAAASVSLQLSFAAVAGIYFITDRLSTRWQGMIPQWQGFWGRALHSVLFLAASSLAVSLGALVFSSPLAALYFKSFSLVGPAVNLLVLWAVSAAFLCALAAAAAAAVFPPLGMAIAWVAALPARWVIGVARAVSSLPYAALDLSFHWSLALWFWLGYALLLFWLFSPRRLHPALPLSILAVSLCGAVWSSTLAVRTSTLTTVAFDVGEGASTLFYSQGQTVLVDCGGADDDGAGDAAADYIQAMGSSHLDALVLTHYHTDHTGGVPELLERLSVSRLILPDVEDTSGERERLITLAEAHHCPVTLLRQDTLLPLGAAELTLYAPVGSGSVNESGLSALCSAGGYQVLITGDMGAKTEAALVKSKGLSDVELLIAGHHGSKNSTSPELLAALRPETAVISTGWNNYGHPAPEVLERLSSAGCQVLITNGGGNVVLPFYGGAQAGR